MTYGRFSFTDHAPRHPHRIVGRQTYGLVFAAPLMGSSISPSIAPEVIGGWPLAASGNPNLVPVIHDTIVPDFDGTNDYYTLETAPTQAYPITLSAWVIADAVSDNDCILAIGNNTGTSGNIFINVQSSTARVFCQQSGFAFAQSGAISDGVALHIVGVVRGASDREIYVNGVSGGTSTSTISLTDTFNRVRIGQRVGSDDQPFNGRIWDCRIYSRSLEDHEIFDLYMEGYRAWQPHRRLPIKAAAAGGGGSIPLFMHHYKQMGGMH